MYGCFARLAFNISVRQIPTAALRFRLALYFVYGIQKVFLNIA